MIGPIKTVAVYVEDQQKALDFYTELRGFEVRHSANGIAYFYGADYGTVADNVLVGNLYMGVSIVGYQAAGGPDPAVGHTIWRNRGTRNTIQARIRISTVRSPRRPPLRGGRLRPPPPRDPPGGGRFGGGRSLPRGLAGCTVVGRDSEPLPYSQS